MADLRAEAQDTSPNLPCSNCRKKHLKCEWRSSNDETSGEATPVTCVRCFAGGLTCERGLNVRFKHQRVKDQATQRWVTFPKQRKYRHACPATTNQLPSRAATVPGHLTTEPIVSFVNETRDIKVLYDADDDLPITSPNTPHRSSSAPSQQHPRLPSGSGSEQVTDTKFGSYSSFREKRASALPPTSRLSLSKHSHNRSRATFPLQSWQEAKLMKYYVEYMCNWFDLCDASRQFLVEVPRRALSCPTLLNAIFALSSRHLSFKDREFDEWISNHYHEKCLKQLSSVSKDSKALLDDDLLAATILLRTLEELELPLLGADIEGHLLGIQVFMSAHESSVPATGLRRAAFWVGLRQEVTMAVASQRPIKISLNHDFVDQSFNAADDETWANRIILHCAKVVRFCYGSQPRSINEYRSLVDYDNGWLHARPQSFIPLAFTQPDREQGEIFPHILYISHAVVIGVVHSILAHALLLYHDPTLPKLGPGRKSALAARDEAGRNQILELCGTALSNQLTIPAMITASLGVSSCGDRFDDDSERASLLDVLIKTEKDHMWPTEHIQSNLKSAWGWS